jgi:hypothetical protein
MMLLRTVSQEFQQKILVTIFLCRYNLAGETKLHPAFQRRGGGVTRNSYSLVDVFSISVGGRVVLVPVVLAAAVAAVAIE